MTYHAPPKPGAGVIAMTARDQSRIASVLCAMSGIELPPNKLSLAQARLSKRIRQLGMSSFEEYCDLVERNENKTERAEMLSALTTNVTKFYREAHHFTDIKKLLQSGALNMGDHRDPIRIWSAGCSSGEEPYTVAFTILDCLPNADSSRIKILATDIDNRILHQAQEAEYSLEDVALIPRETLTKFFDVDTQKKTARVKSKPRSLITFNTLNLNENWPIKQKFDIIMCRNVAIYFSPDRQSVLWERFAAQLKPSGHLMIGHSERISDDCGLPLKLVGTSTYQKQQ